MARPARHDEREIKFAFQLVSEAATLHELRQGQVILLPANSQRPHSSLDDKTPNEAYWQKTRPGYAGPIYKLAA